MRHIHGDSQDLGESVVLEIPCADTATFQDEGHQRQHHQQPQRGRLPARSKLAPELQIPKNRSAGNLPAVAEGDSDADDHKPGYRFSVDAGPVSAGSESTKRYVFLLGAKTVLADSERVSFLQRHATVHIYTTYYVWEYIYLYLYVYMCI
ncbi:hypothetical protein F5Y14DRAFT_291106 [Nemania sp. NC0429]|nr:hypothetical protein F5Y14DRAFT_291106 [Nemania sp. NC0429]